MQRTGRWNRLANALAAILLIAAGCSFQKPDYLATISPADLNRILQREDVFLVDVHTPEQQHIKGTDIFVPYDAVAKNLDKFPADRNTPIFLYCKSGGMANAAARSLHDAGYSNLTNLVGGADAWRASGLPLQ